MPKREPAKPIQVSKLDVIAQQIRTSIRLFFQNGDTVAIHTLIAAAHEVTRCLLMGRKGGGSFIKDCPYIPDKYLPEVRAAMNKAQNFFKHADKDPDQTFDLYGELTAIWIVDCGQMHYELTGILLRESWVFLAWFCLEYAEWLEPGTATDQLKMLKKVSVLTKESFLQILDNSDRWRQVDFPIWPSSNPIPARP